MCGLCICKWGHPLSLSVSVSPGCGWMTPDPYLPPPSPLFSRHICTHLTAYTLTCTRALLFAHPERERPSRESLLPCVYIPESTCLPCATWVWPTQDLEKRELDFYWEQAYLSLLLCVFELTVAWDTYYLYLLGMCLSLPVWLGLAHLGVSLRRKHPWWFWVRRWCICLSLKL